MQYRKLIKDKEDVSLLGYGCMRFPIKNKRINFKETEKQIMYAYENGVNYYDTAYFYHNGKSESVLGEILHKNNIREKVYIADKLPPYLIKEESDIEKIFNIQLRRLKTTYIDFYLMHALSSYGSFIRLKKLGIIDYIKKWKEKNQIKYVGFSFHGKYEEFKKIIDDYDWDFCQIQYNYLDEHSQAGIKGLKYAYSKNIGVVIMEPLRGGVLANKVPNKVNDKLLEYNISPSKLAFEWIFNQKEVSVVLSGMNDIKHIEENINVASNTLVGSLDEEKLYLIKKVKGIYKELMKVPCTGCNYCMPCPYGVDIPYAFSMLNSKYYFNKKHTGVQYITFTSGISGGKPSGADLCIGCGRCEKLCPQNIKIIDELKNVRKEFKFPILTILLKLWKKIKKID